MRQLLHDFREINNYHYLLHYHHHPQHHHQPKPQLLLSPTPSTIITSMCAWMIDHYGSEELKQKWIPDLATMHHFSSYCLTEPGDNNENNSSNNNE